MKIIKFCFPLLTVFVVFLALSMPVHSGCAGDCFSCHPSIEGNKDHEILKYCFDCHNDTVNELSVLPGMNTNGCGENCFECHTVWPQDVYHDKLAGCNGCHK